MPSRCHAFPVHHLTVQQHTGLDRINGPQSSIPSKNLVSVDLIAVPLPTPAAATPSNLLTLPLPTQIRYSKGPGGLTVRAYQLGARSRALVQFKSYFPTRSSTTDDKLRRAPPPFSSHLHRIASAAAAVLHFSHDIHPALRPFRGQAQPVRTSGY